MRKELARENAGLRLGNSQQLDAHHVVREHASPGYSMALALDLIEESQADFGQLRLVLRNLCPAEGGFKNRSPQSFHQVG
jgi:hypothetical protein